MKNDEGEWVQVVSLINWKGFFFPYPTFGGVVVIQPGEHDFNDYLERLTIGKGQYISPEEMKDKALEAAQQASSEYKIEKDIATLNINNHIFEA